MGKSNFYKIAVVLLLITMVVAIAIVYTSLKTTAPILELVAPNILAILFIAFFSKVRAQYPAASIIGIIAFSVSLLSEILMLVGYVMYNQAHEISDAQYVVTVASGAMKYVFYLLIVIAFIFLLKKLDGSALLKTFAILIPVVLVGLFVVGMIYQSSPVKQFLSATLPYIVSALFFQLYSISNRKRNINE